MTDKKQAEIEVKEVTPLKWPEGWSRTLISERRTNAQWKRQFAHYRKQVEHELRRMGAGSLTIYRNDDFQSHRDPGVAVWFSLKATEDFSWQQGLGINSPTPTIQEIDAAFKRIALKHHPDVVANTGGDVHMYFKAQEWRKKATAWVRGDQEEHTNCIPCDAFTDARQNLAAIARALSYFRGLERVGIPAILDRVMQQAFKMGLPEKATIVTPQEAANVG